MFRTVSSRQYGVPFLVAIWLTALIVTMVQNSQAIHLVAAGYVTFLYLVMKFDIWWSVIMAEMAYVMAALLELPHAPTVETSTLVLVSTIFLYTVAYSFDRRRWRL